MVRSAKAAAGALVALAATVVLTGCTTTQHEAARERLDSARLRAALESTRVTVANLLVTPTSVAAVRSAGQTALIVTLQNRGRRAVTDLPISVAYKTPGGTTIYLNAGADLGYFQAHLPAIRARGSLTWVYTTRRSVPAHARVFARVGVRRSVPALVTEADPSIGLRYRYLPRWRSLKVQLDNATSVPQYQLQVYAYATRGSRYVGAADATVQDLGGGAQQSVRLGLVGRLGDRLHVQAIPTVLQ